MAGAPIAIVSGHGKTGRAVAAALERRGAVARPLGRDGLNDPVAALTGCGAVYVMAPNMFADEPAFVSRIIAAAETAGVGRIVYHCVASPYVPAMPHHLGKAISEDLVRRSSMAWTILQPCAYVQNFVPTLVGARPALAVPYDVSRPFGFVDLADVAEAAATVLLDGSHHGATYELGGPALLTVEDVALIAAEVLGRPIEARRIEPDDWAASGDNAALDPRIRDWLLAMFAYYDDHGLPCGHLPLEALLGRSATDAGATLRRELAAH